MPRVSSLNHPSPCLPTLVAWQTLIAPTARCDMSFIAFQHHHAMRRGIVIRRIQTQMLWFSGAGAWSHNRTVVEQLVQHRRVVNIGGGHKDAQRDSSAIDQDMVFNARFGAIRRVRSGLFSPPQATARKCRRHFAIPTRLNVSHRSGANTWHGSAHRPRRASTLRNGHKRFATGRTLVAAHATDNQPITRTGWHQGSSGHQCVGVHQIRVAGWMEAASRSPPTSHRERIAGFSYRQLTKPLRFADTLLRARPVSCCDQAAHRTFSPRRSLCGELSV